MFNSKASLPNAALAAPDVFVLRALSPTAVLYPPLKLPLANVSFPKAVFCVPVGKGPSNLIVPPSTDRFPAIVVVPELESVAPLGIVIVSPLSPIVTVVPLLGLSLFTFTSLI